jgi:hypothetical protein
MKIHSSHNEGDFILETGGLCVTFDSFINNKCGTISLKHKGRHKAVLDIPKVESFNKKMCSIVEDIAIELIIEDMQARGDVE